LVELNGIEPSTSSLRNLCSMFSVLRSNALILDK